MVKLTLNLTILQMQAKQDRLECFMRMKDYDRTLILNVQVTMKPTLDDTSFLQNAYDNNFTIDLPHSMEFQGSSWNETLFVLLICYWPYDDTEMLGDHELSDDTWD